MPLPHLLPVPEIHERLLAVFPEGAANRNFVTREIAAKTIFVALYIGAIEGPPYRLRPDQVTRMTNAQAALTDYGDRNAWLRDSMRPAAGNIAGRWYAANTREPIRDEILRRGIVAGQEHVLVKFPNGESRQMELGIGRNAVSRNRQLLTKRGKIVLMARGQAAENPVCEPAKPGPVPDGAR